MTETKQRMSAAERREMVLEAAVTEFAAHGLAGTSTEDVARRAVGGELGDGSLEDHLAALRRGHPLLGLGHAY